MCRRAITLAIASSPNSFDPRVGSDQASQRVSQLVYDNLLALDDQLQVGPGPVTGWELPRSRMSCISGASSGSTTGGRSPRRDLRGIRLSRSADFTFLQDVFVAPGAGDPTP